MESLHQEPENIFKGAPKIYAIADAQACQEQGITPGEFAAAFFNAGGRLLQYRDKINAPQVAAKEWDQIWHVAQPFHVKPIINDYGDLARQYNSPLHIGQEDLGPNDLDQKGGLFGRSTHNLKEVTQAAAEVPKPAYIGLGAMFAGATKKSVEIFDRGELDAVYQTWGGPIVYIGGITLQNGAALRAHQRAYYAVISDFFSLAGGAPTTAQTLAGVEEYTKRFIAKYG